MPVRTSTRAPLVHQTFDNVEAVELGMRFGPQGEYEASGNGKRQ
jgi:hypothetical protein